MPLLAQHQDMRRTLLSGLAVVTSLTASTACSPSTRASLRNGTGSEVATHINGELTRLAPGATSKVFILAWGNQKHWTREIEAGGCAYLYMAKGYEQALNLPSAKLAQKSTLLILEEDFRLTARNENGEPLGAIMPERRCR
jgi:hypothetical protein